MNGTRAHKGREGPQLHIHAKVRKGDKVHSTYIHIYTHTKYTHMNQSILTALQRIVCIGYETWPPRENSTGTPHKHIAHKNTPRTLLRSATGTQIHTNTTPLRKYHMLSQMHWYTYNI